MKILLVIDHLGSGGAQRQMVELACGLSRHGHAVEVFVYFPQHDFFRPRLDERRIVIHEYRKGAGFSFGVLWALVSLIVSRRFDVVVSYLSSPNIYAELAVAVGRRTKLVVSERTSHHDDKSVIGACLRRAMHAFADQVVANSQAHREWLAKIWWLRNRVACIYNGLDLDSFHADEPMPDTRHGVRLVAVGRVGREKNTLNLIHGLRLFYEQFGYVPEVTWAGPRDASRSGRQYCRRVDELLESAPEIRHRWRWLGVQPDVSRLLHEHHALIHPSLYEGLPNVVCEALATGTPVLVSDVCDHRFLVADGERGFLFDPRDPPSIAAAIRKLTELTVSDWSRFRRNAREYAQKNLGVEAMITAYENLFARLLGRGGGVRGVMT